LHVARELLARAVLAVFGMPILLICAYFGGWPLLIVVAAVSLVALGEYYSAVLRLKIFPVVAVGYLATLTILVATTFMPSPQRDFAVVVVLVASVICTAISQFGAATYRGATVNSAVTLFGVVYIGLMMSFFLRLGDFNLPAVLGSGGGVFAAKTGTILLVVIPVWTLDTFAFIVGSACGRHALAPRLSPKKTVEGAVAGFVGCAGLTVVLGWWLRLPVTYSLALGVLMGIAAQLGDAAESAIKRDVRIKDFGNIFGPHGGIIDRFDGLLFAMPVAWLYLTWLFGS